MLLQSWAVAAAGVLYIWVLMPAYASAQYTPALVLEKPVRCLHRQLCTTLLACASCANARPPAVDSNPLRDR